MRNFLFLLCLAALITGCGKTPQQKATLLLNNQSLPLGEITQLDSVIGYAECFDCKLKAIKISLNADSLLSQRMKSLTELESKGMNEEMRTLALRTKEEITNMYQSSLGYTQRAATIELKKEMQNTAQDFLGWKYISSNDSCTYTVYFNKDVSSIIGIAKEKR